MKDITPRIINPGDRLICRYAIGSTHQLEPGQAYIVACVLPAVGDHERALVIEGLPEKTFGAWRFRAYDPSRDEA